MHTRLSTAQKFTIMKVLESICGSWFFATYVLFLTDKGLTLKEANLLNVVYMVSVFLLDPPTGSLGDRLGHRRIYIAGLALFGMANLFYGTGQTFAHFALAEFTAAIGSSLMSEALEAWMRNETDDETFNRVRSSAREKGRYFGIVPALIGSAIGSQISYAIPWFLSCISFMSAAVIGIFVLKDGADDQGLRNLRPRDIIGFNAMRAELRNVRDGFRTIRLSPELLKVGVVTMVAIATFQPINMFWSITFRDLGTPEWLLGVFWILIALSSGAGAGKVKRQTDISPVHVGRSLSWIGLTIGGGSGLVLLLKNVKHAALAMVLLLLACFVVHEYYRGSLDELLSSYRNKFIENKLRATINSSLSSLRTLGAALGLLLSGFASDVLPPLVVWVVSGAILVLVGVWYARHRLAR
jgi:MFS family permease